MNTVRAVSLQNLHFASGLDILASLARFKGIVMLNLRGVSHPSFSQGMLLQSAQLPSLQLLNLNYCFREGEIRPEARFLP